MRLNLFLLYRLFYITQSDLFRQKQAARIPLNSRQKKHSEGVMKELKLSLISALLAVFVTACGGGGSAATSNPRSNSNPVADPVPVAPATVAVVITDASINDYDRALATITSIELLGDNGHVQIFSGSETVDFLRLTDFVELFAVDETVPPGEYDKIRLHVSDMTLVNVVDGGDDVETPLTWSQTARSI